MGYIGMYPANSSSSGLITICGPLPLENPLALAVELGSVIISADSRQVYHEFDIGTAKPTSTERQRVPIT